MTDKRDELEERLTHFYREVRTEIPSTPPAWRPAKRPTARWLRPVLASAALVVLAVALGIGLRAVRDHAYAVRVTASPTVKSSPQAIPTATPSAVPTGSWVAQRFPIGMVYTMALDPSAVFALYAPGPTNGRPDQAQTKLARIDRNRGALVTAGPFPDAVDLARAGAGLWIAAGPGPYNAPAPPSTQWLTLVDPVTLRVERQVHLPGQPGSDLTIGPRLAGNGSLLWLGYGTHAYRLNPATGSTLLTLNLSGTATSLSLDPTGQRLYLGVDASTNGSGQALVIEVDASTGATLASAQTGGAGLGGPHVAAAADSVWVSYATGMMGAVEHRTATNLSALPIAGGDPTEDLLRGTNGIKAIVGGGPLWLIDEMVQRLSCADPGTGAMRASAQEISVSAFVADSAGAYLGDGDGVATLQPDPSCGH